VLETTGRSIENTLQLVGRLLWRTDQETVTVVDPAGDERLDESGGRVVVERASDAAQLSKLKEAFGTDTLAADDWALSVSSHPCTLPNNTNHSPIGFRLGEENVHRGYPVYNSKTCK